ncbi:MAG: hypothetical protein RLY86_2303 [Pseudomonadota bacterium]|jgi:error-prone DNA polymerase
MSPGQISPGPAPPGYAELQVTTNFSFLRGASHAEELVLTARALGLGALAVTDRNSLAGVVRAHLAARGTGLKLVVGARLDLTDGPSLLCLPRDRVAYGRLSRLLTIGKRRAPKGECWIGRDDVAEHQEGQILVLLAPDGVDAAFPGDLADYRGRFGKRLNLALTHRYQGDDARRLDWLADLGRAHRVPLVATNDVHYHTPRRRMLQDVLTCIREGVTIQSAGYRLSANAERHLKPPGEMARLFHRHPDAVARTMDLAAACTFSLAELEYQYPDEVAPGGDAQAELERLTAVGLAGRYPDGVPPKVTAQVAHELSLIGQLRYAPYFLTVQDIVAYARRREILCQGRGSAANSAVCYALGITSVDPARSDLLFERFISTARNEPPDIDVDFEHERREEVIQYIYEKYGRDRAGIAATVTSYRARGAMREVGKAMGLSLDLVNRLSGAVWGWGAEGIDDAHIRAQGLDTDDPLLKRTLDLARELVGFPRHLSQHVGGFIITKGPLSDLCPIMNAAMDGRTTIEWDKDDIDALRILKVDVLALGMLTCVRKGLDLIAAHYGHRYDLATIPAEQPEVYDMLCRADSLGVFQVESRAQMTMLPRLRPRTFYDLVIEVAIVRPGPIQGDMVHPYLRRRQGIEPVTFPSPELAQVLGKTLGVPLFQEQAMKIAIVAAGFTPDEADRLRRAMATFRKNGDIHTFRDKFIGGMTNRGYDTVFAESCFRQIEGFGTYGFPESHAASFALLVYVSAWIKCFHPDVFCAALLNSQPMGFYAPAQIVRDAREHGVPVLPPDVNISGWDCGLEDASVYPSPSQASGLGPSLSLKGRGGMEPHRIGAEQHALSSTEQEKTPLPPEGEGGAHAQRGKVRGTAAPTPTPTPARHAVRLGFRIVKGLREEEVKRLTDARQGGPFRSVADLWRRAGLSTGTLEKLANADAFRSLGLDRRQALWEVAALGDAPLPLFAGLAEGGEEGGAEPAADLPAMALGAHVVEDYASLNLSLKAHPLALLRERLRLEHPPQAPPLLPAEMQRRLPDRRRLAVAGLVLVRQRPGSAKGVIFVTLEDETGVVNLVLMPDVFERYRKQVLGSRLLLAWGRLERVGPPAVTRGEVPGEPVIHLRVEHLEDRSPLLRTLADQPDRFSPATLDNAIAHADEVRRPVPHDRRTEVARVFPDGRNFR